MLVVVPRVDKREVGVEGEGQGGGPSSGPGEGSRWEEVMARTWREMKRVKGYSEGLHTDWLWRCPEVGWRRGWVCPGSPVWASGGGWVSSLSIWRRLAGWCCIGRLQICRTCGGPKGSWVLLEPYTFEVWEWAGGYGEIPCWSLECRWYWTRSLTAGCENVWECVRGEWRVSDQRRPDPGGGPTDRRRRNTSANSFLRVLRTASPWASNRLNLEVCR